MFKALHPPFISRDFRGKQFEGYLTRQSRILREINFTRPAGAQRRYNRVGTDFLPGYKLSFILGEDARH